MNFDFHNIVGYDISKWQGNVDFAKMKGGGASFVIMKASQGNWTDPKFTENWKAAKGILPRASYHYYDNRYPPDAQARKYFDVIRPDLEGMCWLDLEDRSAGVYAGWKNWFDFLEELKVLYPGVRAGIYSNFFYAVEMLSFATRAQRDYFGQYPLWLANYGTDPFHPAYSSIMVPLPWLECLILQSGTPAIGPDAGVESLEIDYNQFNGDMAKFSQYFKLSSGEVITSDPVLPPDEEGNNMSVSQWYKVTSTVTLQIRNGPGVSYDDVGDLRPGDIVEAIETLGGWHHIDSIYRGGQSIPCPAVAWCSAAYTALTTSPVTPPAPEPTPAHVVEVTVDGVVVFRKELA
jgi:hypothetical protein